MISVESNTHGEAVISTSSIAMGFESVEHNAVAIPFGDLPAVIAALQRVLDNAAG